MSGRSKDQRADTALFERGLAPSRERAQALILAGQVYVGDRPVAKAGQRVSAADVLTVRGADHPWVSRGGLKLAHALEHFAIVVAGSTALDIGASTGGFTDVLLARGARRVFAVDVGHGQLAWKLQHDERVVILDRTNARHLTRDLIPEAPGIVVCDASFIGLQVVLPAALDLAAPEASLIALIKPQFEVGRERVGKGGVVRDPALHAEVCTATARWLEARGWTVLGTTESPVVGPAGNREFLIAARRPGAAAA